ncbi:hypothetical protein SK571_00540 [Lentzea sp. BCCO 10_0798]|uniref:Phage terminase, small subunit, putative, P27 family n=1 Tax=Lentzea kristufekii TaxID=3095430 RepID=A0ABU4THW8_9PSEU|nr:hypothetical protein [Lentzea sp. BCCO 10_0798]MDX8047854.1 hypothetical protein [Lentzea sp. BCCO 10_0798]
MYANVEVPEAPEGINDKSAEFWNHVHEVTPVSDHERTILVQICKALTRIDEMEAELKADGRYTIKGVQGSTVIHPLFTEIRMQQSMVNTLYRTLKLHDIIGEMPTGKDSSSDDPNVIDMIARAQSRKASGA